MHARILLLVIVFIQQVMSRLMSIIGAPCVGVWCCLAVTLYSALLHTVNGNCNELVYYSTADECKYPLHTLYHRVYIIVYTGPLAHATLPYLTLSVNCTSGSVTVNRTHFTHADLEDRDIVDVSLEYNVTNITSGKSVCCSTCTTCMQYAYVYIHALHVCMYTCSILSMYCMCN